MSIEMPGSAIELSLRVSSIPVFSSEEKGGGNTKPAPD
jgi:hypothetical protein